MKRFFGMSVTLVVLVGVFMVLAGLFYWAAAGLGWAFNAAAIALGWNPPGTVSPAAIHYGVSLGNILTLMLVVLMISGSLLTVAERKWSALLQNRVGANRIKVFGNPLGGIPYLAADALKMLTKERIAPAKATHLLYELAPVMAFAPVFALFAIVPVGHLSGKEDQDWAELRDKAREHVFRRLSSLGITGLESHIKFETTFTPLSWRSTAAACSSSPLPRTTRLLM